MAKESGLAWGTGEVDSSEGTIRTIINDCLSLDIATPRGVQDVTGLDKSAVERLLLLADCTVTLNGNFNDAALAAQGTASGSHLVLRTVSSSSVARTTTMAISGQSLPNELFFTDYVLTRAPTGEFTWSSPGVLSDGTAPTWA